MPDADPLVVPLWLDLSAVAVNAVQGAILAARVARERMVDVVGVVMIGIATGLGGGIIRDILLSQPLAALSNNAYLGTAALAALAGMLFAPLVNKLVLLVVALDALALGLYLVVGVTKASAHGLGILPAIFVGVLACTGGTVIRDVLLRQEVALLQVGSFYVVAAFAGGLAYLGLSEVANEPVPDIGAVATTVGVRMVGLAFGWRTPKPITLTEVMPPIRRHGGGSG